MTLLLFLPKLLLRTWNPVTPTSMVTKGDLISTDPVVSPLGPNNTEPASTRWYLTERGRHPLPFWDDSPDDVPQIFMSVDGTYHYSFSSPVPSQLFIVEQKHCRWPHYPVNLIRREGSLCRSFPSLSV